MLSSTLLPVLLGAPTREAAPIFPMWTTSPLRCSGVLETSASGRGMSLTS